MKDPERKPRQEKDGSKPPLRQLKERSAEEREWAYGLRETISIEAARGEIREKLGISLGNDKAYTNFCQWMWRKTELEDNQAGLEDFEAWYRARNPDASSEKIREMGIVFWNMQSMRENDPKLFININKLDLAKNKGALDVKKFELERQKLAQKIKTDIEKGLDALYEEVKANPAALDLFNQFKAVITKATEVNA